MISKLMLLEQVTIQIKKQQLLNKGLSNEIIDKLLQCDPTNKDKNDNDKVGSYTDWITSRYLKDRTFNNFDKLHSQLEQYDKSKHKIPDKQLQNIGQFKTLNDLITFVNNNQDKLAIKTDDFIIEEKNDYDMFYSRDFIIHVPHTKKQSIELGSGTKWCTSQINNNLFDRYYKNGYLFYITNKTTRQKRYNLHLHKTGIKIEFADDKNKHLTYKLFDIVKEDNTLIPQIKSYYEYKNIKPENIVQTFLNCKTVSDIVIFWENYIGVFADIYFEKDETKLLKSVNMIGANIQFIPNPSTKVQLQQLEKDINNINYIESPDNTVLKDLVSKNDEQLYYIINVGIIPEHDVQLQQVTQYGQQIRYIIDAGIKPEHDVQLQQVTNNGYQIKYIIKAGIKPDHDIQLQQVTNYGGQIRFIINAGIRPIEYDIQLQQATQYGQQIKFIIDAGVQPEDENEWHEIQLQQVTNRGYQIQYIIDADIIPDHDIQLQQVTKDGYQIEIIIDAGIKPDHDVKLQQVTQDGHQIRYIISPDEDIQLQQIKQDVTQYDYIKNPTPKQTQLYNRLQGITESVEYISKLLDVN